MADQSIKLDDWLKGQPATVFPGHGSVNFYQRYSVVAEYLNNNVHPHVEKGALIRGDGYLTDHGPEHIKTVVRRASALIQDPAKLSPYEVYLLDDGLHFHDVGNLYGRKGHEKRALEIMTELGRLIGDDVEKRAIQSIAGAHGGDVGGDKDTIGRLPRSEPVHGTPVRKQALAALLRFADELADDDSRAARFLQVLKLIPKSSEVYHEYASRLHSVIVDPTSCTIGLHFDINKADAIRKFGKQRRQVFLLNEIYDRSGKMHLERTYCMRFLDGLAKYDAVSVTIKVFLSGKSQNALRTIGYRLEETGYPSQPPPQMKAICKWTGQSLKEDLLRRRK